MMTFGTRGRDLLFVTVTLSQLIWRPLVLYPAHQLGGYDEQETFLAFMAFTLHRIDFI